MNKERAFAYNKNKCSYGVVPMQKFIGKEAQLIYIDSKRNVSIRNIRVLMVSDQRFKAYCYSAQEIRTFLKSGVVDIELLKCKGQEIKVMEGIKVL